MTTAANKRAKKIVSKTGIYAGLLCYTFILFFPFLIVILTSFTPDAQQLETTKFIWKPDFSLEGYKMVFELDPFKTNNVPSLLQGFINTLWQALIPTVCGLIVSGFASYAYAKFDFPGKSKFFAANLLLMTIPLSAGMTGYLFYNAIGWTTIIDGIVTPVVSAAGRLDNGRRIGASAHRSRYVRLGGYDILYLSVCKSIADQHCRSRANGRNRLFRLLFQNRISVIVARVFISVFVWIRELLQQLFQCFDILNESAGIVDFTACVGTACVLRSIFGRVG